MKHGKLEFGRRLMAHCRREYSVVEYLVVLVAILLLVGARDAFSQDIVPEFQVDVVSVRSDIDPSRARVDLYTRLPYRQLSFINTVDGFTSSYEVTVDAFRVTDNGRGRNLINSKIWDANVVVGTYVQTQADDLSDFTTQAVELPSGNYLLEFELADKNSNQVYVREVPVNVPDFSSPTSLSDITLLESYDTVTYSIVPRVDHRVGTDEGGFQIFYEVYTDHDWVASVRREVVQVSADLVPQSVIQDGKELSTGVVFDETESVNLTTGKNQHLVTIPVEDLKAGSYLVRVSLMDENGVVQDEAESRFVARWSGLGSHIQNIEEAISQLEYIAKKKDINYIRDASNDVERYQRFQNFWEKRDPTPGTKRNERMEEYYYRVASANKQYGAVQDGWKTDRGFVYVRFGEPDYIRRKPYSFDFEPYEVWIYDRLGRQFIFIDKTGFGDFQLLVPIWDERTRLY